MFAHQLISTCSVSSSKLELLLVLLRCTCGDRFHHPVAGCRRVSLQGKKVLSAKARDQSYRSQNQVIKNRENDVRNDKTQCKTNAHPRDINMLERLGNDQPSQNQQCPWAQEIGPHRLVPVEEPASEQEENRAHKQSEFPQIARANRQLRNFLIDHIGGGS